MNIEEIGNKIVKWWEKHNFEFIHTYMDGRTNSVLEEERVIEELKKSEFAKYITKEDARSWCDLKINNEPVNIKITSGKAADNISSKKGLFYSLTGEELPNGNDSWSNFLSLLREKIKDNDKDYYFIVINKNNPKEMIFTSLKKISNLTPNSNNLPFQKRWKFGIPEKNNTSIGHSYVLSKFIESLDKEKKTTLRKKYFPNKTEIEDKRKLLECLNKINSNPEYSDTIKIIKNLNCIKEITDIKEGIEY